MDQQNTDQLPEGSHARRNECVTLGDGSKVFRKFSSRDRIAREVANLTHLRSSSPLVGIPKLLEHTATSLTTSWFDGKNLAQMMEMAHGNTNQRLSLCSLHADVLGATTAITSTERETKTWFDQIFTIAEETCYTHKERRINDPCHAADGLTYGAIWKRMTRDISGIIPEIRYVHGDWSLQKVLVSAHAPSLLGMCVDWEVAGWQDWRMCVASGLWSIRYTTRDEPLQQQDYTNAFLTSSELRSKEDEVWFFEALNLFAYDVVV